MNVSASVIVTGGARVQCQVSAPASGARCQAPGARRLCQLPMPMPAPTPVVSVSVQRPCQRQCSVFSVSVKCSRSCSSSC